jgi:hypothetical protein
MYDVHGWMVQWGLQRDSLSTPSNLTIITCHNYTEKTYAEKHMDYVGIDYVTLQPDDLTARWRNSNKISLPYEYIRDGKCNTDYVLLIDSDDVVFVNDPSTCITAFDSYGCDMLFCAVYRKVNNYQLMEEKREEIVKLSNAEMYINAGVWIGKINSVLDILENAYSFVDDSVYNGKYSDYVDLRNGRMDISFRDEWFPNYPYGVPSDQDILRWIHPEYYPRMLVDTDFRFCLRNRSDMLSWIFDNKVTTN